MSYLDSLFFIHHGWENFFDAVDVPKTVLESGPVRTCLRAREDKVGNPIISLRYWQRHASPKQHPET